MNFFVYSRGAIEAIRPFDEPHVFISITTTDDDRVELPETTATLGILRLVFPDADKATELHLEESLFSVDHARSVWRFILGHQDNLQSVVLHCDAGQCRSPAIAAAISKVFTGDDSEFFRRYRPNMRVFRTMIETWYDEFEVDSV